MVQSDPKRRLLALHAAKEVTRSVLFMASDTQYLQVVTHCSQGQLESVADLLWAPLFQNSENTEETTRNVAAACLGKLATTHPSKYLPQLHVLSSFVFFYLFLTLARPAFAIAIHRQERLLSLLFVTLLQITPNLMTNFSPHYSLISYR